MQRADNLGVSGGGREIPEDIQVFPEEEKGVRKADEKASVQQQEQEQILRELQILRPLFSKRVAVLLQVGRPLAMFISLKSNKLR